MTGDGMKKGERAIMSEFEGGRRGFSFHPRRLRKPLEDTEQGMTDLAIVLPAEKTS